MPRKLPWAEGKMRKDVSSAVRSFWTTRDDQALRQVTGGRIDVGDRGKATGGKHLDAFCQILSSIARSAGFDASEVRVRKKVELAGYYRPSKQWDLIVVRER